MANDAKDRMYSRNQGGVKRWYIDLRHLGGGREALIPKGKRGATSDWALAVVIAADRLREIEEASDQIQRQKVLLKRSHKPEGLRAFAANHLLQKAKGGKVTTQWLEAAEYHLRAAISFFGANRDVASIKTTDVQKYANHLQTVSNGRGGTLSAGSQRHYLNSLSNLFRRAWSEDVVTPGYNPGGSPDGEAFGDGAGGQLARAT